MPLWHLFDSLTTVIKQGSYMRCLCPKTTNRKGRANYVYRQKTVLCTTTVWCKISLSTFGRIDNNGQPMYFLAVRVAGSRQKNDHPANLYPFAGNQTTLTNHKMIHPANILDLTVDETMTIAQCCAMAMKYGKPFVAIRHQDFIFASFNEKPTNITVYANYLLA